MLEILATNRLLNLDIQQEFEMLEIEIEKLPSFLIGQERGIEQGIEQGKHNKAVVITKQLLELNMSLTEIAQITGLTTDELEKLH
jgi:predicted transposase/invertase (TIGR01784 family)